MENVDDEGIEGVATAKQLYETQSAVPSITEHGFSKKKAIGQAKENIPTDPFFPPEYFKYEDIVDYSNKAVQIFLKAFGSCSILDVLSMQDQSKVGQQVNQITPKLQIGLSTVFKFNDYSY